VWVHVLGSAAGGGFPQWNCHCRNCRGVREGSLPCRARTQSSIAVSADYAHWFLFNASPDIRNQIEAFPALRPRGNVRQTPIQGIVLSDAEMDHTLGLLSLREARSLRLYATAWVYAALHTGNPILRTLEAYCRVDWQRMSLGELVPLRLTDGIDSGLWCQAFATLSTKRAIFAADVDVDASAHGEATVGYRVVDGRTGRALVYMPAVQDLNAGVRVQMEDCACLIFDGTCWHDDELARAGIVGKTARAMGHVPIAGDDGSLEHLAALGHGRTLYIHINNTNPLLIEDSPERQAVEARGIEVAVDGMEIEI